MKKIAIEKKIILGYWLAFIVLIAVAVFSYENTKELRSSDFAVRHTNEIIYNLSRIKLKCAEMESASRGFIISPSSEFKATINDGEPDLLEMMDDLKISVEDNKNQVSNLNDLEDLVNSFSKILRTSMEIREVNGFDPARDYFNTSEAARLMREMNQQIAEMDQTEISLLRERIAMRDDVINSFTWVFISLLTSIFIAMVILYVNIIMNLRPGK